MPKAKQPTQLAVTPKGEKYFKQMAEVGYANLPPYQRIEWDILSDLTLWGDPIRMSTFLTEGRDTNLGRAFASLSGRTRGPLVIDDYGRKLHGLIKQGYVKAFRPEPKQ